VDDIVNKIKTTDLEVPGIVKSQLTNYLKTSGKEATTESLQEAIQYAAVSSVEGAKEFSSSELIKRMATGALGGAIGGGFFELPAGVKSYIDVSNKKENLKLGIDRLNNLEREMELLSKGEVEASVLVERDENGNILPNTKSYAKKAEERYALIKIQYQDTLENLRAQFSDLENAVPDPMVFDKAAYDKFDEDIKEVQGQVDATTREYIEKAREEKATELQNAKILTDAEKVLERPMGSLLSSSSLEESKRLKRASRNLGLTVVGFDDAEGKWKVLRSTLSKSGRKTVTPEFMSEKDLVENGLIQADPTNSREIIKQKLDRYVFAKHSGLEGAIDTEIEVIDEAINSVKNSDDPKVSEDKKRILKSLKDTRSRYLKIKDRYIAERDLEIQDQQEFEDRQRDIELSAIERTQKEESKRLKREALDAEQKRIEDEKVRKKEATEAHSSRVLGYAKKVLERPMSNVLSSSSLDESKKLKRASRDLGLTVVGFDDATGKWKVLRTTVGKGGKRTTTPELMSEKDLVDSGLVQADPTNSKDSIKQKLDRFVFARYPDLEVDIDIEIEAIDSAIESVKTASDPKLSADKKRMLKSLKDTRSRYVSIKDRYTKERDLEVQDQQEFEDRQREAELSTLERTQKEESRALKRRELDAEKKRIEDEKLESKEKKEAYEANRKSQDSYLKESYKELLDYVAGGVKAGTALRKKVAKDMFDPKGRQEGETLSDVESRVMAPYIEQAKSKQRSSLVRAELNSVLKEESSVIKKAAKEAELDSSEIKKQIRKEVLEEGKDVEEAMAPFRASADNIDAQKKKDKAIDEARADKVAKKVAKAVRKKTEGGTNLKESILDKAIDDVTRNIKKDSKKKGEKNYITQSLKNKVKSKVVGIREAEYKKKVEALDKSDMDTVLTPTGKRPIRS
jgi:hypothetical protein